MANFPSNQHLPKAPNKARPNRPVGVYVAVCLAAVVLVAGAALGVFAWMSPVSTALDKHVSNDSPDRSVSSPGLEDDGRKDDGNGAEVHVDLPWTQSAAAGEPGDEGWQSEQFSQQSQQQLQRLGTLFEEGRAASPAALAGIVADDFSCHALRPDLLETVFDDGSIDVRRPRNATQQPSPGAGPSALAGALASLAKALEGADSPHVKFKTYRVSLENEVATTTAYFHASGRQASRIVQLNALWHCDWRPSAAGGPPKLLRIRVDAYEEVTVKGGGRTLLADCTEAVLAGNSIFREQLIHGMDHWRGRLQNGLGLPIDGFHGLAIGDVNGDGLEDVYLCQTGGVPNRLLLHRPDGTVTDGAAAAGVDWLEQSNSALLVDLDNDGDQDLVIVMTLGLLIHSNDGRGHFSPVKTLVIGGGGKSLAAADYDDDGDLDLFVCAYTPSGRRPEEDRDSSPFPFHDANNGAPNILLRNDGAWKFTDVTKDVGLDANNTRFSLAAAWDDYDDDGDVDLYVANDFGRNCLYRNDGGRFTNVAPAAGVEDLGPGMSVTWGDYNNDGRMDLYISNMFSGAGQRITYQPKFQPGASQASKKSLQRFARGNSLFENAGDGTFRDVTEDAGVTMGRWAWASRFIDLNNDGLQDLLVANGMITQEDPRDL